MKVLYIDGVGPFGGASRSLYELIKPLSASGVEIYFIAVKGTAMKYYGQYAKDVVLSRGLTRFDNTKYSYYRGIRWIVSIREVFYIAFTVVALIRARLRWGKRFDLIHGNEITEILPVLMAKWLFGAPVVVHVRSPQRTNSRRSRLIGMLVKRHAAAVIAIDESVRATLQLDLAVDVIHNSFTPEPSDVTNPHLAQIAARLGKTALRIGFVGNLHVAKGLKDLLDAARLVKAAGSDVKFLIIGGVTIADRGIKANVLRILGLGQNIQGDIKEMITDYGLENMVYMLGATDDIQSVYQNIDVLAFPSHLDSPGRPVFEAAFSSVPSIVAVQNPKPDTLVHGETGLAFPGKDIHALADAILYFEKNRQEVKRMGANALALASRSFSPDTNAAAVLNLYNRILNRNSGSTSGRGDLSRAGSIVSTR